MTDEQMAKLQALCGRLIDTLIDEADPDGWAGAGLRPVEMSARQRGDRYWSKKNAVATAMLEGKIATRIAWAQEQAAARGKPAAPGDIGEDFDGEIARYEKEAAQQLAKFRQHVSGT